MLADALDYNELRALMSPSSIVAGQNVCPSTRRFRLYPGKEDIIFRNVLKKPRESKKAARKHGANLADFQSTRVRNGFGHVCACAS